MRKFCCVALLICPLFAVGCSSEQDKTVGKTTEATVTQPTKQNESGGGAAASQAKTEDRTKPES